MTRRPTSLRTRVVGGLVFPVTLAAFAAGLTRNPLWAVLALVATWTYGFLMAGRVRRMLLRATGMAQSLAEGVFTLPDARRPGIGPREIRELTSALGAIGEGAALRDDALNRALDDAANQRDIFYSIINATGDGLLLYDSSRRLIAVNQRCGELLGFSMQDLMNREVGVLEHALQERTESPQLYRAALELHFGRGDQPHQDLLILAEPRRRVLRRSSCAVTNHRGLQGRVFTYTDITAESDLDKMKSEFVSLASHELRTPLTSVHGALQLVLTGSANALEAEDRELLEISLANTERLVRLVNDLLDLSKIEAGRMPLTVVPLSLQSLLDEAARAMHGLAATRDIAIRTVCDVSGDTIPGDHDHLLRVLTNLLSNALKYSPSGSAVTLRAVRKPEGVEVSVADQGPGVPSNQMHRLFRPFARLGVQERQAGGTGLGLAISRAIVEQHGGRIWVERNQPVGSRFAFLLPESASPSGGKAAA